LSSDRLQEIFELQRAFDEHVAASRGLDFDMCTWVQKDVLAMMAEMAELLDEVNYKWWKNPKRLDTDAIKEELVDIFHFLISACIRVGMDAEDLHRRYVAKNAENFRRQRGGKEGYRPGGPSGPGQNEPCARG